VKRKDQTRSTRDLRPHPSNPVIRKRRKPIALPCSGSLNEVTTGKNGAIVSSNVTGPPFPAIVQINYHRLFP
jgi:hypothetical protein